MDKKSKFISIGLPIVILACVFALGWTFGSSSAESQNKLDHITNKNDSIVKTIDFSPFWKSWQTINEKFVATGNATTSSDQKRVWGAIAGMAESLGDPYTVFFPPEENKSFASEIAGNFEGVGMEIIVQDGILTVVSPLKGSPAEKAGMMPQDKIIKIDDKITKDLTIDQAVKLIRGPEGSTVKITVLRGSSSPKVIPVVRGKIEIPTVETEILKPELGRGAVFIIRLYNFNALSANLFRKALREFIDSGTERLVIDVRGNPGGYLESAVDMASFFLSSGKIIVSEDYGKNGEQKHYRSKGYDVFTDKLKLAILVNGGSASASEILAGALQDHGKATIVGTKTFGKGSVQELVKITNNPETSLKITIARWLTPKGNSISDGGVKPDIEVEVEEADIKAKKDPQLEKAVEALLKK